jgi:HTH domain.
MNKEIEILAFLNSKHVGKDKAIHSKKLEKKFNICPRTVRTYISNLRKSGVPICSDETGYWIAKDPKEATKTVKRLDNFVGEVNSARTGLAIAAIQMRSITRVTEENIQITVKVI